MAKREKSLAEPDSLVNVNLAVSFPVWQVSSMLGAIRATLEKTVRAGIARKNCVVSHFDFELHGIKLPDVFRKVKEKLKFFWF